MDNMENITVRKPRRTSSLNNLGTLDNSSTFFDATIQSSTNTSIIEDTQNIRSLVEKNLLLEEKLRIAYQKIEHLSLDNCTLTLEVEKLNKKLELCGQPQTLNSNCTVPASIKQMSTETTNTKENCMLTDLSQKESLYCNTHKSLEQPTNQEPLTYQNQQTNINITSVTRKQNNFKKMCIISSNNVNKMLEIAENTFTGYNLCHYIIPNGGIKQLFTDLDKKLIDFTFEDYCIIYLGERDFEISNNYRLLLNYMKKELYKIDNTNVVICSPNFKLNNVFVNF